VDDDHQSALATDTIQPATDGYRSSAGYGPAGGRWPAVGYAGTVGGDPGAAGDQDAIWSLRGGASAQPQRPGSVTGFLEVRTATRRAWQRLHSLRYRRSIARLSGLGSKASMTRMLAAEALLGERRQPAAASAVPVRVRELGGRVVWLRPRSTDRLALEFVAYEHHLPPPALAGPVRHIAVFGANIGLLTADLANRYPQARLLGVEADHDNAQLARRNLAYLGGRCVLEETAVWYRDETLHLSWEPDAWGQIVTGPVPGNRSAATTRHVGAVDAANLLGAFTGPAPVDYLLVNIESAWYEMLRHGRWTANVHCIKIEIQDHYDKAVPLLESLGYQAQLHRLDWGAFAVGIRPAG
jgi:FkbM family methyltransferase